MANLNMKAVSFFGLTLYNASVNSSSAHPPPRTPPGICTFVFVLMSNAPGLGRIFVLMPSRAKKCLQMVVKLKIESKSIDSLNNQTKSFEP